ncbi:MOSC domain-containing protein [Spirulina sp. 06S082]|uniref:MOSC domain-containing protein n=1 Tax=Spirulina sp. 06S082 TaxID=3110248 RepID=UPI002B1FD12E|nr:MOSC N-terminal beta barrel domain-containing protein [Spirulina sp. 06S082]MEA5472238.1 MOSC N-terminal beta barrel domain-containing protein [Spirulina sp. 06S082]
MQICELAIYPIKACRGISLSTAEVTPKGFLWDREFMITDRAGKFLTQRQYPQLALIEVKIEAEKITLSAASYPTIEFTATIIGEEINVEVWRDRLIAIDQGDKVANWLQSVLKTSHPLRLVRQSPRYIRPINPHYTTRENAPVSFADGYPFLITNTASLAELNHRLEEIYPDRSQNVPMNRFRPNIVIESDRPFLEDEWKVLQIGEVVFDLVKPCSRCIVTTTDQISAQRNELREPLKTLGTFRHFEKEGILFGENAIPRSPGQIKRGDTVQNLTN